MKYSLPTQSLGIYHSFLQYMIHTFIFGCTPTIIIFAAKTKSFFGLNLKASGYWPKIREASVTLVICQAALEKEVHMVVALRWTGPGLPKCWILTWKTSERVPFCDLVDYIVFSSPGRPCVCGTVCAPWGLPWGWFHHLIRPGALLSFLVISPVSVLPTSKSLFQSMEYPGINQCGNRSEKRNTLDDLTGWKRCFFFPVSV